jgi:adenine-specific DNA-methyltransferase
VDNVWDDIPGLGTTPGEDLGYPTQKTAALLERIFATGSDPGDLVLDPSVAPARRPRSP